MTPDSHDKGIVHATKRCPECYTYVSLRAAKCPSCNSRLGEVDTHGMAKRTVNWSAYFSAFLALLVLCVYLWWAFFR